MTKKRNLINLNTRECSKKQLKLFSLLKKKFSPQLEGKTKNFIKLVIIFFDKEQIIKKPCGKAFGEISRANTSPKGKPFGEISRFPQEGPLLRKNFEIPPGGQPFLEISWAVKTSARGNCEDFSP